MASLFFLHFTVLDQKDEGESASKAESEPFYINDESKFWYAVKFLAELITRENAPLEERMSMLKILTDMAFPEYRRMVLRNLPPERDDQVLQFSAAHTYEQAFQFFVTLSEQVGTLPAADFATWFVAQLKKYRFSRFELVA